MGHVLFAAPRIARYHLLERLARALRKRGHRVTVLAGDPPAADFFKAQGLEVRLPQSGRILAHHVPLDEFERRDCLLEGRSRPASRRLERLLLPLFRLFEGDAADVLVFLDGRSGLHRLIHFLGREYGHAILHLGAGGLPGTMQRDELGCDGDSTMAQRGPRDYAQTEPDEVFLAAVLASWLAGARPTPLAARPVTPPTLSTRLGSLGRALAGRDRQGARDALSAWREALPAVSPEPSGGPPSLPAPPFVAVLLQGSGCPRLRLDAPAGADPIALALSTARAAAGLASGMRVPNIPVLCVADREGPSKEACAQLSQHGMEIVRACDAPQVLATAVAVTTVNHPLGMGAILAGTPLLHTGSSIYGIEGVATRTSLDRLEEDLTATTAKAEENDLRTRFLTHILEQDHLWCSAEQPDQNGLHGLIGAIEEPLRGSPREPAPAALTYRPGPAWPLQTEPKRSPR